MLSDKMFNKQIYKIILSKPKGTPYIRGEIKRNGEKYQASLYTAKQVFHSNHDEAGIREFISASFGASFLHYTAWDGEYEYFCRVSKKGKVLEGKKKTEIPVKNNFGANSFNREKNHIIREGENIPVLVDIGVFTKQLKVNAQKSDKFHQINRFLELISDETKNLTPGTQVNIIDFGCGKSYLTFVVYYYFSEMKKMRVNICGLDLNEEIVNNCASAALKYGYENLFFVKGDIGAQAVPPLKNWGKPETFNIVISLHACDTATDYALFNSIKWNADLICAVPCCQHELRNQMKPKNLKLFSSYGIIEERISSLATDAIRSKFLEISGYKVNIIEFTGFEHTSKNLLIRAKKIFTEKNTNILQKMEEIRKITDEFSFKPTLEKLLNIP